jgi:hypothetical protein
MAIVVRLADERSRCVRVCLPVAGLSYQGGGRSWLSPACQSNPDLFHSSRPAEKGRSGAVQDLGRRGLLWRKGQDDQGRCGRHQSTPLERRPVSGAENRPVDDDRADTASQAAQHRLRHHRHAPDPNDVVPLARYHLFQLLRPVVVCNNQNDVAPFASVPSCHLRRSFPRMDLAVHVAASNVPVSLGVERVGSVVARYGGASCRFGRAGPAPWWLPDVEFRCARQA